jgi:thymidylate synthase
VITIEARNAHEALPKAITMLYERGLREDSRNGPVLRAPGPVATVLSNPEERLTFHSWRDSNPFFLHVEALWMLAGRDDLKQLTPYVKNIANYSDDGGKTSPGAYGKRWRDWFLDVGDERGHFGAFDQIDWVVKRLLKDHTDRRVVIQMWDASADPHRADSGGKDVPCNLTILPWVMDGALHLTVFNRSNDIVWGLYSANAVQFSTLQEYLAGRLGLGIGKLITLSNNFHAYLNTVPALDEIKEEPSPYPLTRMDLTDLWGVGPDERSEQMFQEDLSMLFEYKPEETQLKARSSYIRQVTMPLVIAHKHYRASTGEDRYRGAQEILAQMPMCDWFLSASNWVGKRYRAWVHRDDDKVEQGT